MAGCLGTLIGILIIPLILGTVAYALSGMVLLFWVVSIVVFILGLPGILIGGIFDFIHSENEYTQDRADYRELMRDISEDERMDRYLDKLDELSDN